LSSTSETSYWTHGKSEEQKPRRTPRRMKAAIRCQSEDDEYPHQALQAYSNLVMTTDLKTACRAVSHKPCEPSIVSAYRVCEHLLTILLTWSLTDSLFEMVTPNILIVGTRRMSGSDDGWVSWHFLFLPIITISADLLWLRVKKLIAFAHSSMLSNSRVRLSTLLAGTMRYVSSAYLASEFPVVTGVRSAALTTGHNYYNILSSLSSL